MIVEFERHLRGTNLAENTVKSYLFAVRQFYTRYDSVTKRSLKEHMMLMLLKSPFPRSTSAGQSISIPSYPTPMQRATRLPTRSVVSCMTSLSARSNSVICSL